MPYQIEQHWYEILCNKLRLRFIKFPIDERTKKGLMEKLRFCGLNISPDDVYSSCVSLLGIGLILTLILSVLGFGIYALLTFFGFIGLIFYIYYYPTLLTKYTRIKASSELVLSILYMIVSLRLTSNLENAINFAASNLSGPVGRDLKKMMWELSTGKYLTTDALLVDFANKWKEENFEFYQALDMIRTSMNEKGEKREMMLDESINVLLRGNMERMKKYATGLKNPLTIITMMGLTLPILTIVLFPIITIFMSDVIKPAMLVLFYNIILPLVLYWVMTDILRSMPLQFSVVDISLHPEAHRIGYYPIKIKGRKIGIPLLLIAFFIGFLIISLGIFISMKSTGEGVTLAKLCSGLIIISGIATSFILYSFFSFYKNIEIRDSIAEVEKEFGNAMFQLGHILYTGQPIEKSMEKLCLSLGDSKIVPLFKRALLNIRKFGYTVRKALLDEKVGIVNFYPSNIIRNMLDIIVDSIEKGIGGTSKTTIAISQYLKSAHNVEEYMKEILEEMTSEMSFMMSILAPVSCGIVVGLATVMIMVLYKMTLILASITGLAGSSSAFSGTGLLDSIIDIKNIIPVEVFTIIVGVYMLEVIVLISIFLSTLEHGGDPLEKYRSIANGSLIGVVMFSFCILLIYFIFGAIIKLAWST